MLFAPLHRWAPLYTSRYDASSGRRPRPAVDFFLVKSLIYESWFQSGVVDLREKWDSCRSPKRLLRISRLTRDFLSNDRLFEPQLNLEIGCWYLRRSQALQKLTSACAVALLRYNAGESRPTTGFGWHKSPPPAGVSLETICFRQSAFPKQGLCQADP
jgi:hypothetical protein